MLAAGFDRKALEAASPRWVHSTSARFQDIDAAGFLFFARMFDCFHDAYLAFMEQRGMPHAEVIRAGEWGVPLRHAEAHFLSPVRFGDSLEVGLVRAAWDRSVLKIGYRVAVGNRVAAVGTTEHVCVALPQMSRIEPPASLRQLFASLVE